MKWTTREGRVVSLHEMSDDHLCNVALFLERKLERFVETADATMAATASLMGEMATYYAENECDQAFDRVSQVKRVLDTVLAEVMHRDLRQILADRRVARKEENRAACKTCKVVPLTRY